MASLCGTASLVRDVLSAELARRRFWLQAGLRAFLEIAEPTRSNVFQWRPDIPELVDDNSLDLPLAQPSINKSPEIRRSPWYREALKLVAGILLVAGVAGVLAATLGGNLSGDRPSNPAVQPSGSRSIYDSDPDSQTSP